MMKKYFNCQCGKMDHMFCILYDSDYSRGMPPELYLEVQLNPYYNFFQRIWLAIKYVFGSAHPDGHWDCSILQHQDVEPFIQLLQDYMVDFKTWKSVAPKQWDEIEERDVPLHLSQGESDE